MLLDFASQIFFDSRSFQRDFACSHYSGAFKFSMLSALPALPALPALRSFLARFALFASGLLLDS